MGTPIDPPVIPDDVAAGSLCPNCWGSGKTFGPIDTPSEIQITFSGVNLGEDWQSGDYDPIDGTFTLEQNSTFSCEFNYQDADFTVAVVFFSSFTQVFARDSDLHDHFNGMSFTACELEVLNDEDSYYTGGSIVITLPGTT